MRERVEVAANILGLMEYLERYPRQLSGGQRQRVAMGRAIVRDPQVFLFDEPLSNLDAKLRVQMRTEIKELHQRLTTTSIYVTHDQIEAMTMADKIVVMNAGKTEQIGSPLELYDNPANLFVAGFIGSPSMNFLKGKLVRNGTGMQVQMADGLLLPAPNSAAVKGARLSSACAPSTSGQVRRGARRGRGGRAHRRRHPDLLQGRRHRRHRGGARAPRVQARRGHTAVSGTYLPV